LWAFVDHGPDGTGEPVAALLRPGNAGSNTAADHLTVIRAALRQLPGYRAGRRPGKNVLIRVDGAGATHELLDERQNPTSVPDQTPVKIANSTGTKDPG
jgi:hypothetical protein